MYSLQNKGIIRSYIAWPATAQPYSGRYHEIRTNGARAGDRNGLEVEREVPHLYIKDILSIHRIVWYMFCCCGFPDVILKAYSRIQENFPFAIFKRLLKLINKLLSYHQDNY